MHSRTDTHVRCFFVFFYLEVIKCVFNFSIYMNDQKHIVALAIILCSTYISCTKMQRYKYTHTKLTYKRIYANAFRQNDHVTVEHKKQNQPEFSFIYFAQNLGQQLTRSAKVNSCMYALKFGHYHFHSRCDFCDSDSHFHAVRKSNFSSVYFPSRISCYLDFDTRLCWFPKTEHTIIIWFAIERFVLSNFVHLIEHIWWTSRTFVQNMLFANCPIGYNFSHFSSFLSHSHSLSFIRSFIHSDLMC